MRVLLLGNYDNLSCNVIDNLIEKSNNIKVDFLTESIDDDPWNKNIKFIKGCRRDIKILRSLKDKYDVVIDLNCVLKDDIENIFNEIQFSKYVFKSTFQVYYFMPKNIILTEESTTESYYQDVLNLYLNSKHNRSEIYAREKLKCERILIKKSKERKSEYIILRPSKIYCNEDTFYDLNWINKRLNHKCPIIFKDSNILENNIFNPIYVKDLANIISEFLITQNISNEIYNVAQDQLISTFEIVKYLSEINLKQFEYYVLNEEHFKTQEFENYGTPNIDTKILSNEKLKKTIKFKFTDFKLWLNEINESLKDRENLKIDNYINEKNYMKKYLLVQQKANNIKIIR